jgi:hypothetical protein
MPFLKSRGATFWENQQVCIVYLLVAFFIGCFCFFCYRSLLSFFVIVLCYRWTVGTSSTFWMSQESNLFNENELQPLPCQLPIPLCPIVGFAQHLAIFEGCCAAFAPGG